jgi:hypothetical protein
MAEDQIATRTHIEFCVGRGSRGVEGGFFFVLLLQSFDWSAAFHLELLQAILFIIV